MNNKKERLLDKTSTHSSNCQKLFQLVLSLIFISFPIMVFYNLNRGLDLTDVGHYYNTLSYYNSIESLSSQYFLFWKLLQFPTEVYSSRLVVFFLFFISGLIFAYSLIKILNISFKNSIYKLGFTIVITSSVYLFYLKWIPDPSYNSLGLIEMFILVGLMFLIIHRITTFSPFKTTALLSFVAGFILIIFAVSRPPSAILFFIVTSLLYASLITSPFSKKSAIFLLVGFFGSLFFLGLSHFFVEPLDTTLQRQLTGLETRNLRGKSLLKDISLERTLDQFSRGMSIYTQYILWSSLAFIGTILIFTKTKDFPLSTKTLRILSEIGVLGIAIIFAIKIYKFGFVTESEITIYQHILTFSIGIICISYVLSEKNYKGMTTSWKFFLIAIYLYAMPFIFSFGTNTPIITHSLFASGFFMAVNIIFLSKTNEYRSWMYSVPSYFALSLILLVAYTSFTSRPYRINTPLLDQNQEITLRDGLGGEILVDKRMATFMNQMSSFYEKMGEGKNRPHLIDLSGSLPFLHYHLDAKLLSVPWLRTKRKKGQAYFEYILKKFTRSDLQKAWVIDMPGF